MNIETLARSRDTGNIVNEDIQQILDEIGKTSVLKLEPTYKNVLNQPERVAISSTSAVTPTEITSVVAESAFTSFTVNLPRPALNVKNLQLLSANIPQAQVNIQDNALVFWYYKLRTQNIIWNDWLNDRIYNVGDLVTYLDKNYEATQTVPEGLDPVNYPDYWTQTSKQKFESPNLFNLYYVRLLPSFYKKETIILPQTHGFNQTFNSYEELSDQLKLACDNPDPILQIGSGGVAANTLILEGIQDYLPQIAGDISIFYSSEINKYLFKGNNVFVQFDIPQWDADTYYPEQSLILYTPAGQEEQVFYNWSAELGNPPLGFITTSWTPYPITAQTVWNTYLAAGYNDPNVIELQGIKKTLDWNEYHTFLPNSKSIYYNDAIWTNQYLVKGIKPADLIWENNVRYNQQDIVYYNGEEGAGTYIALQENTGVNPFESPDFWSLIYNPWHLDNVQRYTGLGYLSALWDMYPLLGNTGQPFTDTITQSLVNNYTLNRVLGFTWNGLNMLTPFESLQRFKLGNLVTLFYNRLRPIPYYWYIVVFELGTTYDPEDPTIYTADAFCNLVYSSVVNIYTRILGGSTTDSVRNTNLLAIVPMNCGNLGVTFTNNFIDNPLTKIDTDIYSVEFSFTTETDQPYWFSNNAVITLQLKLGYEK